MRKAKGKGKITGREEESMAARGKGKSTKGKRGKMRKGKR